VMWWITYSTIVTVLIVLITKDVRAATPKEENYDGTEEDPTDSVPHP